MEMYDVSEFGNAEAYMIQGSDSNLHLTSPVLEQSEAMYNEGAPELIADQGIYYPAATNYAYYCTGFESPGEWEDHNRIFGIDGPDIQYTGAQNEFLPYVYYTPSYGYAQSQYNPYNPYIPGAVMGIDGPFVGAQPYYPISSYQNSVSSPAYVPILVQPDAIPNSSADSLIDTTVNRFSERGLKTGIPGSVSSKHSKPISNQTNSSAAVMEGPRPSVGSSKESVTRGNISVGGFRSPASSHVFQGKNSSGSLQPTDNISNGKVISHHNQLKAAVPVNSGISDFGSSAHGRVNVGKLRPKIGRALNDINGSPDTLGEQNRGPRVNRSKNELAVRAYTTKAGDGNGDGNIIIYTDQYNKNDFPIDYADAKFFIIKSYSEDDVHKSIKYNVWSSTPHGNKKLNSAYEDAQRLAAGKPRGCPIFLFYSVNASGQFCGVAEMVGPVDFNRDMDFWQQDKWSGSFPVKWHIIKDVPNVNFRHIILENNENKPVTNSRDTQEIMFKKGLEMLKIFKNHTLKTSLLDDFMYYENRQKIMQEEKARLRIRNLESPFFVPAMGPPRKLNCVVEAPQTEDKLKELSDDLNQMRIGSTSASAQVSSDSAITDIMTVRKSAEGIVPEIERKGGASSKSKIGSTDNNLMQVESKHSATAAIAVTRSRNSDVVTVGSVSVKVNGFGESSSSGILTVGTIPLDPRALQLGKKDGPLNTTLGGVNKDV